MPDELAIEVGPADAGRRLDVFLADHLGSRSAAQRAIDGYEVLVDGDTRPKRHVLRGGETVVVQPPSRETADVVVKAPALSILHEDADLLVVDKPAGMVVHPGPGHSSGTLAQILGASIAGGEPGRPGIVHRLDRDTSGLLIVARSEEAHRRLRLAIQRREVSRHYAALVMGHPDTTEGTIDAPIGRDARHRTKVSMRSDRPRSAVTHFRVVEALPEATLLEVELETGRTHQIRVHLQAIGLPVAGDPVYGAAGAYGLARQFLHARRLVFAQPMTGAPIDVSSPLPQDLETALALARKA